jgi:hypothetical protein
MTCGSHSPNLDAGWAATSCTYALSLFWVFMKMKILKDSVPIFIVQNVSAYFRKIGIVV